MNETIPCLTGVTDNEIEMTSAQILPSGRSVALKVGGDHEELEVRSPSGDVEVRVTLTTEGAVVRLRAARLELESPDTVAVNCRRFTVNSVEGIDLTSGGELRVKTAGEMHFNGGIIHLNC